MFRSLNGKEEEAVTIMDNRDVFTQSSIPNNDVLIICDHATNDVKGFKIENEEAEKINGYECFDKGAADLASALSERLECMAIMTNFSRLLIDPSLDICNENIIRHFYR